MCSVIVIWLFLFLLFLMCELRSSVAVNMCINCSFFYINNVNARKIRHIDIHVNNQGKRMVHYLQTKYAILRCYKKIIVKRLIIDKAIYSVDSARLYHRNCWVPLGASWRSLRLHFWLRRAVLSPGKCFIVFATPWCWHELPEKHIESHISNVHFSSTNVHPSNAT